MVSNEEDCFDPLQYPVKKRSLSNGDSFFPKQSNRELQDGIAAYAEKLAVTASDPGSSG